MINPDFLYLVLRQADDDWVSLGELRDLHVEALGASRSSEESFWSNLKELLQSGYIVAGDIDDDQGFVPWIMSVSKGIEAMRTKSVGKTGMALGDVCWFELTKSGADEFRKLAGPN